MSIVEEVCRILVIDDSADQRLLIKHILDDVGSLTIDEADSGMKGLELLSEYRYAAVLLDIEMPGLLGFDVAKAIKYTEKNSNTPIIVVTSHNDSAYIEKAYQSGATDYIQKPIKSLILQSKVAQFAELHRSQQHTLYLKQQNDLILNSASHGVIKIDINGKIIYANRMANIMLDQQKSLIGTFFTDWFKENFLLNNESLFEYLTRSFDDQDICKIDNIHTINQTGKSIPVELSCSNVIHRGAREFIIFFQNISDRIAVERKLIKLANFDHLTQLGNRANFTNSLKRAHSQSCRYNSNFALVMIDLDKFKNINDTLGHDVGDAVLVEFSKRLKSRIRESDTIVRLGGDEFALILEHINSRDATFDKLQQLQRYLSTPFNHNGCTIPIESSIGIAYCESGEPDLTSLQKWADLALYAAKTAGRNTIKDYSPCMSEELDQKMDIESRLRTAIDQGEIKVYYQAKVSSLSQKVVGFEALCRWQNQNQQQRYSPSVFIPIAENSGLIFNITRYILEHSCQLLESWKNEKSKQHLCISINLSAVELAQKKHILDLKDFIQRSQIDASKIYFEITETSLLSDDHEIKANMEILSNIGCKLSLDDFGTGYSSLSHIQNLPINEIKIDRSFVQQSDQQRTRLLMKAIIGLAKTFGLSIVAEGIETEQQYQELKRLGCSIFQGFYFSKAITDNQIDKLCTAINDNGLSLANTRKLSLEEVIQIDAETFKQERKVHTYEGAGTYDIEDLSDDLSNDIAKLDLQHTKSQAALTEHKLKKAYKNRHGANRH